MRADRVDVRMGRDERRVGEPRDVPEALLVQMREVDHDPSAVAGLDEVAAVIGQARPGVGARRDSGTGRRGRKCSSGSRPGRSSAGPPRRARRACASPDRSPRRPRYAGSRRGRRARWHWRMSRGAAQTSTSPFEARSMRRSSEAMCSVDLLARAEIRAAAAAERRIAAAPSSSSTSGPSRPRTARRRRRSHRQSRPPACAAVEMAGIVAFRKARSGFAPPRRMSRSRTSLWPSKTESGG